MFNIFQDLFWGFKENGIFDIFGFEKPFFDGEQALSRAFFSKNAFVYLFHIFFVDF